MNKFPEEFEVTIIVKCDGKVYCQGPHRNILTNSEPNIDMLVKMLINNVSFLTIKLVKDLIYDLNKVENKDETTSISKPQAGSRD